MQNLMYTSEHIENKKSTGTWVQCFCPISLLFFYCLNKLKIDKYTVIPRKI
jgi:hypothetical protein